MFGIDTGELALIAVVALLVLGPERLPGIARTAGALVRRARTAWAGVRAEIEREIDVEDVRRNIRDAARSVDAAKASVAESARKVESGVRGTPGGSGHDDA